MTHLKKSLALLLAFVMIFSSMSVAASAVDADAPATTGERVEFTVRFFRNENFGKVDADGKPLPLDDDKWVVTTKAAPGEPVKARIYVETNFGATSFDTALLFDSDFFNNSKFPNGSMQDNLDVNSDYVANTVSGESKIVVSKATGLWYDNLSQHRYLISSNKYPNGLLVDGGFVDSSYFNGKELITGSVTTTHPTTVEYVDTFDADNDNWIAAYDLEVKNDATTNALNSVGVAEVPVELRNSIEKFNGGFPYSLYINFNKGDVGSDPAAAATLGSNWEIKDENAISNEGVLTTTSAIILNGNGGTFSNGEATAPVKGVITARADKEIAAAEATLSAPGQTLLGWSSVDADKGGVITNDILSALDFSNLTSSEIEAFGWKVTSQLTGFLSGVTEGQALTSYMIDSLSLASKDATQLDGYGLKVTTEMLKALAVDETEITFDYDEPTLYALWDHSGVGSYTVETYLISQEDAAKLMDNDATNDPVLTAAYKDPYTANINDVVSLQATTREGFTFVDELSTDSVKIEADGSSVLKAFYTRNTYTATYHYEDNTGSKTEENTVAYDEIVPEFGAVPGGIPQKAGHTFVKWSLDDDSEVPVPVKMPAKDIDIYPVFKANTYTIVFDATDGGKLSNGSRTASLALEYGDKLTVTDVANGKEIRDESGKLLLKLDNPTKTGYKFLDWDLEIPEVVTQNELIVATYDAEIYTVTFLDENGVKIDYTDGGYYYGDMLEKVDVPAGYRENSWMLDGVVVDFPVEITGSITLQAVKSSNVYNAIFDANSGKWDDGDTSKTLAIEYNKEITGPDAEPAKKGYSFLGWSANADATAPDASLGLMPAEDGKTFYAVYDADEITLTFDSNGGNEIAPVKADCDAPYEKPADPEREGYTFAGWYVDGVKVSLPDTMPNEDVNYTAEWNANSYNVIYKNGTELVGAVSKAKTDEEITVISGEGIFKEGHTFDGWLCDADGKVYNKNDKFTMPAEDVTFEAQWTPNKYVIYLDANGGSFADDSTSFSNDEVVYNAELKDIVPADPAWSTDAKTFKGWAKADDATETIVYAPGELKNITMPAESLNLVAIWDDVIVPKYTVEFRAGEDGKFEDGSTVIVKEYAKGDKIEVPVPIRDGYNYTWDTKPLEYMEEKDLVYVAIWTPKTGDIDLTIKVITQYLDADGKVQQKTEDVVRSDYGIDGETVEIYYGATVPAVDYPIPYNSLYSGASNVADETNAANVLSLTLDENGENVLVAHFKLAERTATFDANEGTFANDEDAVQTGLHGSKLTAPVITRPGYTLVGWVDSEGNAYDPAFTTTFTADETYEAVWSEIKYNLTYNAEDGIPTPENGVFAPGTKINLPAVSKDGYRFDGWKYVAADGTETVYGAGQLFIMPEADAELTAQWTKVYSVTYKNADGGDLEVFEGEDAPAAGERVPATSMPEPKKDGYKFTGWNGMPEDGIMPDEELVLTPAFSKIYNVTYAYAAPIEGAPALPTGGKYIEGDEVILEAFEAIDGYRLDGWYANGEGDAIAPGAKYTMPADDVEFILNWELVYTLTFDTDGGTAIDPEYLVSGEEFKLTAATTKNGYVLKGWENKVTGETFKVGETMAMPDTDTVLTAIWEETTTLPAETVTVTVTVPPETVTVTVPPETVTVTVTVPPETVTLPVTEPTTAAPKFEVSFAHESDAPAVVTAVKLPASVELEAGKTHKLLKLDDVAGYKFAGWEFVNEDGVKVVYPAGHNFVVPEKDVVLTAIYDEIVIPPAEYGLTFDENGGSTVTDKSLKEGEIINLPKTVREGYKFLGWFDDNGTSYDAGDAFEMPAKAVNLTAGWDLIVNDKFNVSYKYIGDTAYIPENAPELPAGAEVEETTTYTVAPVPAAVEGYIFQGWYYNGVKYDGVENTSFTMPGADVVIEGFWLPDLTPEAKYPVSYSYKGDVPAGAAAVPAPENVEADTTYTVAPVPAAVEGYTFKGWFLVGSEETEPVTSFKMPAESVEIVGVWVANTYDIVLDAAGGTFEDGTAQFVKSDVAYGTDITTVIPNVPAKVGHTFTGWVKADGTAYTIPDTMPAEDIILTATWEKNTYTITFDTDGGNEIPAADYKYGDAVEVPADPTREGFDFAGWVPGIPETMPEYDVTVVAQWTAKPDVKTYNFVADADGGVFADGSDEYKKVLKEGEAIGEIPTPTRDGYEFVEWTPAVPDAMPGSDLTVKAVWKEKVTEPASHTVNYYLVKGEDGVAEAYTTKVFTEGETMVHPDVNVEGFTFKGWTDENGNQLPDTMGTEDIDAYAKLEFNSYKVTYLLDEGGAVYETYDVLFASEVPVPDDPTRAGFIFSGWNPQVVSTMPAHDLTYTAKWIEQPIEPEKYTARFVVDGRTHEIYVLEAGDAIPTPDAPSKFGFVFVGWEPEVPATMPAENVEFVAQWEVDKAFIGITVGGVIVSGIVVGSVIGANTAWITAVSIVGGVIVIVGAVHLVKNTHTVTYMVDGEIYKVYKVVEGTKIPVPADPVKDGFKFDGWNPEVPEKMGETDLVFEATWDGVNADNDSDDSDILIPDTGSAAGIAAFAIISGAAAVTYVIARKKKED